MAAAATGGARCDGRLWRGRRLLVVPEAAECWVLPPLPAPYRTLPANNAHLLATSGLQVREAARRSVLTEAGISDLASTGGKNMVRVAPSVGGDCCYRYCYCCRCGCPACFPAVPLLTLACPRLPAGVPAAQGL